MRSRPKTIGNGNASSGHSILHSRQEQNRNTRMSEAVAPARLSKYPSPTETSGFWRTYIFSRDHKMIGKQFLLLSGVMLVCGGLLAMLMRWELAWPETPLPLIGASQQFIDSGEPQTAMDKTWQVGGEG